MDYLQFESWKNNHPTDMANLIYSKYDDIFIYTKVYLDNKISSSQVLYAEDLQEAMGYFSHIFIRDLIIDRVDDLEFDSKERTEITQCEVISLMNYRFNLRKIFAKENCKNTFFEILKQFNEEFCDKYEFCILEGADKLREFLSVRYLEDNDFAKKQLESFCCRESFSGELLNDFIKELFQKIKNS